MADLVRDIDGKLSLVETQNRCNLEQGGGFQLTSIKQQTVIKEGKALQINHAEFDEKLDDRLTLTFIEVGSDDPEKLKEEKEGEGFTVLITETKIFVNNHITKIMVLGKPKSQTDNDA